MLSHTKNINIVRDISFGDFSLSEKEKYYYEQLNSRIIHLCNSLPSGMQNRAMLFLLKYSNIEIGQSLDFYKNFYKPVWSIIPAITELKSSGYTLNEKEISACMCGHAMALFLHSLDDHLNDGELSPDHLLLLLRSQAWRLFNKAINELTANKEEMSIAESLINEYYEGIFTDKRPQSLDEYCKLFKKEISTWYIFPMLTAAKATLDHDYALGIRETMGHFGIAWRVLDDIQDLESDLAAGRHTAVYFCLSEKVKNIWDSTTPENACSNFSNEIREEIFRELASGYIPENLSALIARELDLAQENANSLGLHLLGQQYRAMGEPLRRFLFV